MKMMVDTAVMAKGHQYVFLSPLGVKAAKYRWLGEHVSLSLSILVVSLSVFGNILC